MYTVKTKIEGVAPLLFNRHPDERGVTGTITEPQRVEMAKTKVHSGDKGLMLPAWNIKQTLTIGGSRTLKGKSSITNYVKACCFPEDAYFGCKADEFDFMHEAWGRIPPRTGAMNKIYRPAMKQGWKLDITLAITDDRLEPPPLRLAWEHAGLMVGFGAWRPEYGRFVVLSWEVVGAAKGKKK